MVRTLLFSAAGVSLTLTLGGCGGGGDGGDTPATPAPTAEPVEKNCDACTSAKGRAVGALAKVSQCAIDNPPNETGGIDDNTELLACACTSFTKLTAARTGLQTDKCLTSDGLKERDEELADFLPLVAGFCQVLNPDVRSSENTAVCTACESAYSVLFDLSAASYDCAPGVSDPGSLTPEQSACVCEEGKKGVEVAKKVDSDCKDELTTDQEGYVKMLLAGATGPPYNTIDCDDLPAPPPGTMADTYV